MKINGYPQRVDGAESREREKEEKRKRDRNIDRHIY